MILMMKRMRYRSDVTSHRDGWGNDIVFEFDSSEVKNEFLMVLWDMKPAV